MDIFGIKNLTKKELEFNYDSHYRNLGIDLQKAKTENDKNMIRKISREKLDNLLCNIHIDINTLKDNFINLILNKDSSKYLWILYGKYENEENYIDKISDILKRENKIIRGGANIYKTNGWMAHTLYVYQIINNNIAYNIEILNCNGNTEKRKELYELHIIYSKLPKEAKFILRIFALIHDIGVIEDVKSHDKVGSKYVKEVLQEIGLNQEKLNENDINIEILEVIEILKLLINQHVLITSVSSESSDLYVEKQYKEFLKSIPQVDSIRNNVSEILFLLAYADLMAVDEKLMDTEKYKRTKNGYLFFNQINNGRITIRDKKKVAIERICDMTGKNESQNLIEEFDNILEKNNINEMQFVEDMYNIKRMRYTLSLMKRLNDFSLTIKIYYELFELIKSIEDVDQLKNYTIIFVPDKEDSEFIEQFTNGNLLKCINKMKELQGSNCTYEDINMLIEINFDEKFLYIRVI